MRLSYSAMSTYETCPAKYGFQYVSRLPTRPSPALSFGDSLHKALYRFYSRPVPVAPSLQELLETLDSVWVAEGYADDSEQQTYHAHARQVLEHFYADNAHDYRIPAALEHRFQVEVEGVTLTGVIDRLDRLPDGEYEIIDYKTNRRLPPASRVHDDLQLSIYYLAAGEIWAIAPVRLTLYFLLPGQRMSTTRTASDTDRLKRRIVTVAERIAAGKFEPHENPLCDWCDFQEVCPVFRHRYERGDADPSPRMTELVDEWISLKRQGREVYRRLDELNALINAYCEEHDYRRLYGSNGDAIDRRPQHVTTPDTAKLRSVLEPMGLWDRVLSVDAKKLSELVEGRGLPPDVEDAVMASREEVRTQYALFLVDKARTR